MIDQATVSTILDTADIVDVVSDFVSLKKRGANWVGLCPFHNDRNPSFYVSRSKGICKCFSCGQGGSAVNFIMLHEQMTYVEALKYLAKKYHIDIKERELTDEEKVQQSERESMIVLNEWACQFFENQLWETTEGQEIGLSYFRQRGFTDATIRKFRLGYSPDKRNILYAEAIKQGYNREILLKLGLCKDDNNGGGYDFYRGRVMFPIFNVAGNVIAFGGRTLKKEDRAKYFNSPESIIYDKSKSTMYGLFQAKRSIASNNKCYIVEGYADVISMHQAGFENVVASSGTALTDGHIHLLQRFTNNVTELFDGDDAGIHAAMRGVDMLLRAGMNIKVLTLPDGEDPDSYAQKHSSSEVEQYIKDNECDFITFKTGILLKDAANDPIKRAEAITEVVKSISVIPNSITRAVYAKECASRFEIQEQVLLREIQKHIMRRLDEEHKQTERDRRRTEAQHLLNDINDTEINNTTNFTDVKVNKSDTNKYPFKQEEEVIRYTIKYGMCHFCDSFGPNQEKYPMTVIEYLKSELESRHIDLSVPVFKKIFEIALGLLDKFAIDYKTFEEKSIADGENELQKRLKALDPTGLNNAELEIKEKDILSNINKELTLTLDRFRMNYLEKILCSHSDDAVRNMSYNLISEKNQLSKIYTQYGHVTTDFDRLFSLIPKAINNLESAITDMRINNLKSQMAENPNEEIMKQLQELYKTRNNLSKLIGDRVVNP